MGRIFWVIGLLLIFSYFGELGLERLGLKGDVLILILGITVLAVSIFHYRHLSDEKDKGSKREKEKLTENEKKKRKALGYESESFENQEKNTASSLINTENRANDNLLKSKIRLEKQINSTRRTGIIVSICSVSTLMAAYSSVILVILSIIFLIYGLHLLYSTNEAKKLLESEIKS